MYIYIYIGSIKYTSIMLWDGYVLKTKYLVPEKPIGSIIYLHTDNDALDDDDIIIVILFR